MTSNATIESKYQSYQEFNSILLLGEADFSFARAFAHHVSTTNSTTTNSTMSTTTTNSTMSTSTNCSNASSRDPCRPPLHVHVTATEYGDSNDIAERYYDGNQEHFQESIRSLYAMSPIREIMCGLNARLLGLDDASTGSTTTTTTSSSTNTSSSSSCCTCHRWNDGSKEFERQPMPFWNSCSSYSYDLIIFNFPHSEQAGRATKLVKALFKQLRTCVNDGRLPPNVMLEMRLRILETDSTRRKNIRADYNHQEAAQENDFVLAGCWPSDLEMWHELGYQHKWTKKNASCRDMVMNCNVWRWRPKLLLSTTA